MFDNKETIAFLIYLKEVYMNGDTIKCCIPEFEESFADIVEIIKNGNSGDDIYYEVGAFIASQDSEFKKIVFREDCYDYLIKLGFSDEEAFTLTEGIRKGIFHNSKYDIYKKRLVREFLFWASGVKYLASRTRLFDIFKFEYERYNNKIRS